MIYSSDLETAIHDIGFSVKISLCPWDECFNMANKGQTAVVYNDQKVKKSNLKEPFPIDDGYSCKFSLCNWC